jgi:hypothetical protein
MAGTFLAHIERQRSRAATQPTRPAGKPLEEMSGTELDAALIEARREAVAANRAVAAAAAAAEYTRPPTLAAKLRELQRGQKKHWR